MSPKDITKKNHHPNTVAPGGNAKSIALIQEMQKWDKIDLNEAKQVQKRVDKYFKFMAEHDSKPLVAGLAQALGIDRRVLYEVTRGLITTSRATHIPQECKDIIIEAYRMLEVAWEFNFYNGNINPATGIFLAKNHYGYRNQTEVVVEPRNVLGQEQSAEDLEKRLLASIAIDGKK